MTSLMALECLYEYAKNTIDFVESFCNKTAYGDCFTCKIRQLKLSWAYTAPEDSMQTSALVVDLLFVHLMEYRLNIF